jgi:hypothetical protein
MSLYNLVIDNFKEYDFDTEYCLNIYITDLVCYTYFHWFFSSECQHIFGKQTGYIFQSPKTIKTWTTKHPCSVYRQTRYNAKIWLDRGWRFNEVMLYLLYKVI